MDEVARLTEKQAILGEIFVDEGQVVILLCSSEPIIAAEALATSFTLLSLSQ